MQPIASKHAERLARREEWHRYEITQKQNTQRLAETNSGIITYDPQTQAFGSDAQGSFSLKFTCREVGHPGEGGYPLFIVMPCTLETKAGVSSSTALQDRYLSSVQSGLYVTCTIEGESEESHWSRESCPLYERLISNMMILKNADPNRVYLMGYGTGGDGVFAVVNRIADRLAAASVSAGFPNVATPSNLHNTPMLLQCGDHDTLRNRHAEIIRFGEKLLSLQTHHPRGYEHSIDLHVNLGAEVPDNLKNRSTQLVWQDPIRWLNDNPPTGSEEPTPYEQMNKQFSEEDVEARNTNAVDFLLAHTRPELPNTVVWDLSMRAPLRHKKTFYWLNAGDDLNKGVIHATRNGNSFVVKTEGVSGTFSLMLNFELADLAKEIRIDLNGVETSQRAYASLDIIEQSTKENGDLTRQFSAKVDLTVSS